MTVIGALLLAAGCAAKPKSASAKRTRAPSDDEIRTRAPEVQQALIVFADRFIAALAEACDQTERNAKTPQVKLATQARKIGGALAAMKNAVNPNPYGGLLDTAVMVTLLSDVAGSAAARELYGEDAQRVADVLASQKAEIWELASRFVAEAQLEELRQSIKSWEEDHPQLQYVALVRIGQFPEASQIRRDSRARLPNSVFGLLFLDPLSNLDPAVREVELSRQLAERAFFYIQRMPLVIAWQTQQIYTEMLSAPEVQTTIATATTLAASGRDFASACDRFAATVQQMHKDLPQLRNGTIEQTENAVARQREAAIRQAATQVSAERDAAARQLASYARAEQQQLTGNLRALLDGAIDRLFARSLFLLVLIVAAFVAFRVFSGRASRARPRDGGGDGAASATTTTTAAAVADSGRLTWTASDGT